MTITPTALTAPPTFVTPVGSVIAYAGPLASPNQLLSQSGWLPCDGTLYSTTDYKTLYGVLQTLDGASGTTMFAAPDYRGVFLRGVDGGSGNDPDSASRVAPRPDLSMSGATGDTPGSYQADAVRSHTHTYEFDNGGDYQVMAETVNKLVNNATWGQTTSTTGGKESRPPNTYVNFLVCWNNSKSITAPTGGTGAFSVPVGSIMPFAGSVDTTALSQAGWMVCDGTSLDSQSYTPLYTAIGTAFGGTGTQFSLPDLRGCFLRGVDSGDPSGRDPDAASRTAPAPTLQNPGNSGNAVGSFQSSQIGPHAHSYNNWDVSNYHHSDDGCAKACIKTDDATQNTSSYGGNETRPTNIYVYWLIKYQ